MEHIAIIVSAIIIFVLWLFLILQSGKISKWRGEAIKYRDENNAVSKELAALLRTLNKKHYPNVRHFIPYTDHLPTMALQLDNLTSMLSLEKPTESGPRLHLLFNQNGAFVEAENDEGRSLNVGEWHDASSGLFGKENWSVLVIDVDELRKKLTASRS